MCICCKNNTFNFSRTLHIASCNNIRTIKGFPFVKQIICYNCPLLVDIQLPSLTYIYIRNCPLLKDLNSLKRLKSMNIDFYSPNITARYSCVYIHGNVDHIDTLHATKLYIYSENLTSIKVSHVTKQLRISSDKIVSLPDMPNLKNLSCDGCTALRQLPYNLQSLEELRCSDTSIEIVNSQLPKLKILLCRNSIINKIESDIPKLKRLDIYGNSFICKLPDNLNALKYLNCSRTNINAINLYPNLRKLECSHTLITELPDFKRLKVLNCNNTQITSIKHYKYLTILYCYGTLIERLPKFDYLDFLNCNSTNITYVPLLKKVRYIDCSNSPITLIESINSLEVLICKNSLIKELPFFKKLLHLDCSNTLIESLNIPKLNTLLCDDCPRLTYLCPTHKHLKYLNELQCTRTNNIVYPRSLNVTYCTKNDSLLCIRMPYIKMYYKFSTNVVELYKKNLRRNNIILNIELLKCKILSDILYNYVSYFI